VGLTPQGQLARSDRLQGATLSSTYVRLVNFADGKSDSKDRDHLSRAKKAEQDQLEAGCWQQITLRTEDYSEVFITF
jgi:hypothetical protein